ncbi:MAG TPA: HD domain-containing protein [Anaerolineaceae bacterium]|nr:HD domain-containing protein [Anaerolineaceae bacterium]
MNPTSGPVDRAEIERLTQEYGGDWGSNHTRRLLKLIAIIGQDQVYDEAVVWTAAHLHDWGGYGAWAQPGVDHALRSAEVAAAFLAERGLPPAFIERVAACIREHHNGNPAKSIEAILLSDADALDFLGVIGLVRDFSKKARDLRSGYETVVRRKAKSLAVLCLARSQQVAAARVATLEQALAAFEAESFGDF